jgi:monothiol glutaredoxin
MALPEHTRQRIDDLLARSRVVLFMKGTRTAPRCGFSATAAGILNELVGDFASVDVLADEEMRQGIKDYGNWPTIPQLYVDRELIGGSDIIGGMYNSGELHDLLGVARPDRTPPVVEITAAAAEAIRNGMADDPGMALHVAIDGRWQAQFMLKPAQGHEIRAESGGIVMLMDLATAQKARGMRVDWVDDLRGSGLTIFLPLAPVGVRPLSVEELAARLQRGDIQVLDVRPERDRHIAPFPAARSLDPETVQAVSALPKDTALAFLCHHGNSSRQAAEHFRGLGFSHVYNVEGGIDAWSQRVDSGVPRY